MPAVDQYIAEISIVAFNFAPRNWMQCNGQMLNISQNQALFSILGTTYGGNGVTTFALPDFRGRAPVNWGNTFSHGQRGGEENHVLLSNEMPQHSHTVSNVVAKAKTASVDANTNNPVGNYFAENTAETKRFTALPDTLMGTVQSVSTVAEGGSQPHSNMQPYVVLNFIIATQGIFPSRN